MLKAASIVVIAAAMLATAHPALADWDSEDPHKMHYPQLPGGSMSGAMNYWAGMGDDWQCSQSGYVEDIHFWICDIGDDQINNIWVRIYSDDRSGAWSQPGDLLWQRYLVPGDFAVRDWNSWLDQVNIENIVEPFYQTEDTIYWLIMSAEGESTVSWNSSISDPFEDVAVHSDDGQYPWIMFGTEMGTLSFVITPEPGTLCLLVLGGLAILGRARRRV